MSGTRRLQIAIAERSPIVRIGLAACLRQLPGFQITTIEARDYADLIEKVRSRDIDIVIANPNFDSGFSPVALREATMSTLKVVAIETYLLDRQTKSQFNGTISIVDDIPTLTALIDSLHTTEPGIEEESKEMLSSREKEVVALVVKGMTNKEIADKLFLSVHTVMTHRRNIARKLEIHSATGLTIYAIVNRIVDLSEIRDTNIVGTQIFS